MAITSCKNNQEYYICKPCGLSCDKLAFSAPGTCPHCHMDLIKKSDLEREQNPVLNKVNIQTGSGEFLIEGGKGNTDKVIKIYYHKPKNYTPESRVLMVIPGAGRNGDSYRDAWIEESEKYGVLILSPVYAEKDYSFEAYHLGGVLADMNLRQSVTYVEGTNIAQLNEDLATFNVNPDPQTWLFQDFDRIFDHAMTALGGTQTQYDMFGHSAGGHILHRMAIFNPQSKTHRIMGANASFYTLPDTQVKFPFGIKDSPVKEEDLGAAFSKKLVVLLGALDNETEKGGTILRSVTADTQGTHRLARGTFFFNTSKAKAEALGLDFNWELKIIPNTGHDHQKMGNAAAGYLYGNSKK